MKSLGENSPHVHTCGVWSFLTLCWLRAVFGFPQCRHKRFPFLSVCHQTSGTKQKPSPELSGICQALNICLYQVHYDQPGVCRETGVFIFSSATIKYCYFAKRGFIFCCFRCSVARISWHKQTVDLQLNFQIAVFCLVSETKNLSPSSNVRPESALHGQTHKRLG